MTQAIFLTYERWAASRETDLCVAAAIHQLETEDRDADKIWEDPTEAEMAAVDEQVAEWVRDGTVEPQDAYCWGQAKVVVPRSNFPRAISPGTRVRTADHITDDETDSGIVAVATNADEKNEGEYDPEWVFVAWKSGVSTWVSVDDLVAEGQ